MPFTPARSIALAASAAAAALALAPRAALADPPQLVQAYIDSVVHQCGGQITAAVSSQVVQRIDLNGDKVDDWVIDGSAYPCPTRPAVFADQGALITVFLGSADGRAHPALQRAGFGAHLERHPDGKVALLLTLAGRDCGEDNPKARCDREVQWSAAQQRLDLAPLAPARKVQTARASP